MMNLLQRAKSHSEPKASSAGPMLRTSRRGEGFTLVELLITVAMISILAVGAMALLNPLELLRQGRDTRRLVDLAAINDSLILLKGKNTSLTYGTANTVYISIPDSSLSPGATSTCSTLSLPALPSGYQYQCVSSASLYKTDGTGWIPVNFDINGPGTLSQLPVDPTNAAASMNFYVYVPSGTNTWEVSAILESRKNRAAYGSDAGDAYYMVEKGSGLSLSPFNDTLLRGYWPLDEGIGTVTADYSDTVASGTLTNSPVWEEESECRLQACISFDGANDHVVLSDNSLLSLNPAQDYSWSMWVRVEDFAQWSPLIGFHQSGNDYVRIYAHTQTSDSNWDVTQGIAAGWRSSGGYVFAQSANNVLSQGQWAHVAVTYDASQALSSRFKIYVNGADVTDGSDITTSGSLSSIDPGTTSIGGIPFATQYIEGAIDDVRYFSRLLEPSEVKMMYYAGK